MPRRNRVDPFGAIAATPERGALMGNRGVLHDEAGRIRRDWRVKRWLLCRLEFRGRRRAVMAPNRYTELFFLDEAAGLAAGHRPCFECQRARFLEFRDSLASATADETTLTAGRIDDRLHAERVNTDGSKRLHQAELDGLPDGVFVTSETLGGRAYLVLGRRLLGWSFGGYGEPRSRPKRGLVSVLTPEATVSAIRAGYVPLIHPSAAST